MGNVCHLGSSILKEKGSEKSISLLIFFSILIVFLFLFLFLYLYILLKQLSFFFLVFQHILMYLFIIYSVQYPPQTTKEGFIDQTFISSQGFPPSIILVVTTYLTKLLSVMTNITNPHTRVKHYNTILCTKQLKSTSAYCKLTLLSSIDFQYSQQTYIYNIGSPSK